MLFSVSFIRVTFAPSSFLPALKQSLTASLTRPVPSLPFGYFALYFLSVALFSCFSLWYSHFVFAHWAVSFSALCLSFFPFHSVDLGTASIWAPPPFAASVGWGKEGRQITFRACLPTLATGAFLHLF